MYKNKMNKNLPDYKTYYLMTKSCNKDHNVTIIFTYPYKNRPFYTIDIIKNKEKIETSQAVKFEYAKGIWMNAQAMYFGRVVQTYLDKN